MDISNFFNWFIGWLLNLVSFCFNLLSQIKFNGTNLFAYSIGLIIVGVFLSIFISSVKAEYRHDMASARRESRKKR